MRCNALLQRLDYADKVVQWHDVIYSLELAWSMAFRPLILSLSKDVTWFDKLTMSGFRFCHEIERVLQAYPNLLQSKLLSLLWTNP